MSEPWAVKKGTRTDDLPLFHVEPAAEPSAIAPAGPLPPVRTQYEQAGGSAEKMLEALRQAVRALARRKGVITVVDVKADAECVKYLPANDHQRALALLGGIMQSAGLVRVGSRRDPVSRNEHALWKWDV